MQECKKCPYKAQCDSYNANRKDACCIIHEPVWLEEPREIEEWEDDDEDLEKSSFVLEK